MNTYSDLVGTQTQPGDMDVPGLILRGFEGETDYPKIVAVLDGCSEVDGLERADSLEDVVNNYAHLHHSDPYSDMLFAEVNGEVVGYTRCWWEIAGDGDWIGFLFGYVLPQWRRKGIGSTFFRFTEARLSDIARQLKDSGELPSQTSCFLTNEVHESERARVHLTERFGYQAVRFAFEMVRPNLENIPELSLPDGVEVREVKPEHLRQIWEASNEAFRDHWGSIPDPWESFESFIQGPDFDPSLLRVAWQGDQVVGMVLNFIDKDQNEKFGRKRGYTENICVRRPWRKQGVARALIALSLKAHKARGMQETALGVDAENISGALQLYKFMGYQVVKRMTIYRKQLQV